MYVCYSNTARISYVVHSKHSSDCTGNPAVEQSKVVVSPKEKHARVTDESRT